MLGNIEESIMANYKKALENGNFEQAKKATVLATKLRELIEVHGFEDTKRLPDEQAIQSLNVFKPTGYSHFHHNGTMRIFNQLINLTEVENKLVVLLSGKESKYENINIITREEIKNHVWPNRTVSNNAVRILISRIRKKIEPNPQTPEILISFNKKGYIFLGEAK